MNADKPWGRESFVHTAAVSNAQNQYCLLVILDKTDNPVIPYSIAP